MDEVRSTAEGGEAHAVGTLPAVLMAIRCTRCGREYDVTLFQFGRTIHCTCGTRVDLESRIGPTVSFPEPRFIADAMLGGLARWLRILGSDTAYDPAISDGELVQRGLAEGRHILTRDRALLEEWRVSEYSLLEADGTEAQLKEVLGRFDLMAGADLFSRCPVCNSPLEPIPREEVQGQVPPGVFELHDAFTRCPDCHRLYWEGSHAHRVRAKIEKILGG